MRGNSLEDDARTAFLALTPALRQELAKFKKPLKKAQKALSQNHFVARQAELDIIAMPWCGEELHIRNALFAIAERGLPPDDTGFLFSLGLWRLLEYGLLETAAYQPAILKFLAKHRGEILEAAHSLLCKQPGNPALRRKAYYDLPGLQINPALHKAALRDKDYKTAHTASRAQMKRAMKAVSAKELAAYDARYRRFHAWFPQAQADEDMAKKPPRYFKLTGAFRSDAAKVIDLLISQMTASFKEKIAAIDTAQKALRKGSPIAGAMLMRFRLCQYLYDNIKIYHSLTRIALACEPGDDALFWSFELSQAINHGSDALPEFMPAVVAFVQAHPAELYKTLYRWHYTEARTLRERKEKHRIIANMLRRQAVQKAGAKIRIREFGKDPLVKKYA